MINRLKKLLCAGLIGASLIFGSAVEAGVVTDRLPLTCYCEKRVNTYNGPGGNAVGYISANVDLIQVTQVRGDGWAYGSYPTSRGRVARWFRISDLCADVNYSNRSANVRGNQTVFRTRNGGDTLGSVSNNESVIVIADNGSRAQIVYRLDNGTGYKMGWVASSAVPSNSSNPTRNVQTGYAMLNDGWYKISPMHATNRVLDVDAASTAVGANIQLWDNNASESQPNQVFYLRNVGNNWFTLKAGHCDLNVAAANTGGGLRTNVQLASPNPNSAAQLWRLVYSSTQGAYYIESRIRDRLAFDCADTGSGNGTNIWLWEYGDVNWNKWRFTPVRPPQNNQQSSGGLKGDVNGDGQVNQSDLDQLMAYVKGQTQSINRDNSDVNGDGNINISDVSALLNKIRQNPPTDRTMEMAVTERMKQLSQNEFNYKVNTSFRGKPRSNEQCKGFGKNLFEELFGVSISSTKANDFELNPSAGYHEKSNGRVRNTAVNDGNAFKSIFMNAKPGSFIQMKRRRPNKNGNRNPHSAILLSVDNDGVQFFEANADGNMTIQINRYIWAGDYNWGLADRNTDMTIYEPDNYKLR